jgi:very-short-patch-repair endonuclease
MAPWKHHHRDPESLRTLAQARTLRKEQTGAEARLWHYLRGRRLSGLKLYRQFPFDWYILDFFCPQLKLCIEIDGPDHFTEEHQRLDQARTEFLNCRGIRVLRFSNVQVYNDLQGVLEAIYSEARQLAGNPER